MTSDHIQREYERRLQAWPELDLGWSFMYSPASALLSAKYVLVGLNPGGREKGDGGWDYQDGENAYVDQPWNANGTFMPLQIQVQGLLRVLGASARDVFAAQFVPFRSPSWDDLPDKEGALKFGSALWREEIVGRSPARLYLSIGKLAGQRIAGLLQAKKVGEGPVDWGRQTWEQYRAADGRTVLAFPHLSRYSLFEPVRKGVAEKVRSVVAEVESSGT